MDNENSDDEEGEKSTAGHAKASNSSQDGQAAAVEGNSITATISRLVNRITEPRKRVTGVPKRSDWGWFVNTEN